MVYDHYIYVAENDAGLDTSLDLLEYLREYVRPRAQELGLRLHVRRVTPAHLKNKKVFRALEQAGIDQLPALRALGAVSKKSGRSKPRVAIGIDAIVDVYQKNLKSLAKATSGPDPLTDMDEWQRQNVGHPRDGDDEEEGVGVEGNSEGLMREAHDLMARRKRAGMPTDGGGRTPQFEDDDSSDDEGGRPTAAPPRRTAARRGGGDGSRASKDDALLADMLGLDDGDGGGGDYADY